MQPPPAHRIENPSAGPSKARKRPSRRGSGTLTPKGLGEEDEEADVDGTAAHATAAAAAAVCMAGEEKRGVNCLLRAVLGWNRPVKIRCGWNRGARLCGWR